MARKRLSKSSLLWFIRSRSYVTLSDVRRRFGLDIGEDVTGIRGPSGVAFVGLPMLQARVLQELWCEGKVGLEFAHDIMAPSVSGVYATYGHDSGFAQLTAEPVETADADGEDELERAASA